MLLANVRGFIIQFNLDFPFQVEDIKTNVISYLHNRMEECHFQWNDVIFIFQ